jgi:uncharacterized RmlC-like cupin family protein
METSQPLQQVTALRPGPEIATTQGLPYFTGISADTAGARGLAMHLVVIPPGGAARPHVHQGYETGIYVLQGQVETRYGPRLEQVVVSVAGDFLFIPPGVPHEARNLSQTEAARAVVARNDPDEREKTLPYELAQTQERGQP